ncbi:unknown [Eubacterium sp. CAG:786]|nr:unknown [Eubacterium sp. CAG:786]
MLIISAAVPLFQLRPTASRTAFLKYGSSCERYTPVNLRHTGTRNNAAISFSFGSRLSIPSSIPEYTTGSVISSAISTERLREVTQMSASTVMLATGTAFTAEMSGESSILTMRDLPAARASATPLTVPTPKPRSILPVENPTLRRNSADGISCASLTTACTGETSSISCPSSIAPTCHITSQNSTHRTAAIRFFIRTSDYYAP